MIAREGSGTATGIVTFMASVWFSCVILDAVRIKAYSSCNGRERPKDVNLSPTDRATSSVLSIMSEVRRALALLFN